MRSKDGDLSLARRNSVFGGECHIMNFTKFKTRVIRNWMVQLDAEPNRMFGHCFENEFEGVLFHRINIGVRINDVYELRL